MLWVWAWPTRDLWVVQDRLAASCRYASRSLIDIEQRFAAFGCFAHSPGEVQCSAVGTGRRAEKERDAPSLLGALEAVFWRDSCTVLIGMHEGLEFGRASVRPSRSMHRQDATASDDRTLRSCAGRALISAEQFSDVGP